jgi:hypothetical protein
MNPMRTGALMLLIACGALAGASSAQGRIMTVTRQVAQFSQAEHALADALRKNDAAATDHLLAADFELRDGASPNQPTPRAQWITVAHPEANAEQMAVHDYGDTVVVSFVSRTDKPAGAAYVVDVWRKQGADWQLAVRYQTSLGATKTKRDTKPTGRN